ncbi:hypothetical protein [Gordonia sp. (in: high G+C Gram-positive bacteria)]|uniref:hypothetical protein n=1 Tax=Gordonia sp. (in: high G+C Gram-positive bacteria) TaxID=84139 RepID=UPI003C77D418
MALSGDVASLMRWVDAVELGARGRAAAARTVVADLLRDPRVDAAVKSLSLSTRASLTRQAGRHADAQIDDGAALLVAAQARTASPWARAAQIDALVGLAADSLGIWDFDGSRRLLDRAAAQLWSAQTDYEPQWACDGRLQLRLAWVRTELALYSGAPAASLAARAVELAADAPSIRHRLKTALIATAASNGDTAADDAERIANDCAAAGLAPLEWAARTMLAGLRPDGGEAAARAAELQAVLIDWGMPFVPVAEPDNRGSVGLIND